MTDYVKTHQRGKWIAVMVFIMRKKSPSIGEKMYEINENDTMNGYNWDALFNY